MKRKLAIAVLVAMSLALTGCNLLNAVMGRPFLEGTWLGETIRVSDGHKEGIRLDFKVEDVRSPGGLWLITGTIVYAKNPDHDRYSLTGEWDGGNRLDVWWWVLLDKRSFECAITPDALTCNGESAFSGDRFVLTAHKGLL